MICEEDIPLAKMVIGQNGAAIRIGSCIIDVVPPRGVEQAEVVDLLVSHLRRSGGAENKSPAQAHSFVT